MGRKRKSQPERATPSKPQAHGYPIEETFEDSEDEFYSHRDKILLDEGPAAKRRRKLDEQDAELQPSDEEVLEVGNTDESEDEAESGSDLEVVEPDQSEDEEDERFWGTSRRDYYNADAIETEADALEEEAEARRLQQKHLKSMTDADFGFDETEWTTAEPVREPGRPVVERLPPVQIATNATKEERLSILRTRYPEFEPLAEDLVSLTPRLEVLKQAAEPQGSKKLPIEGSVTLTKFRALSAYLAAITMYMAVLTSTKDNLALPPAELRDHPIMGSLLRCRQLWDAVKGVEERGQHTPESHSVQAPVPAMESPDQTKPLKGAIKPVSNGNHAAVTDRDEASKERQQKRQARIEEPSPEPYRELPPVKIKKQKKPKRSKLQDIISQAFQTAPDEEASDFGDEAPLTHEEAADKAKKKRSLRFYTSQIAQKANKRGAKSREAGGDDDLPYKERIRDRQERLMREAGSRANASQAQMEDSGSEDDAALAAEINGVSNDYYNQIVSKSQVKKADKAARAEAYAEAARQGAQVYEEEQVGPDGKRKITYAIAKNKGLTPKRKKEVRNPRVKKKKQYEAKMKKLGSMRPVYKGGEGKGGYGGELTGIKTNVIKSVKL
jgi:U3 small nucleolar RNA-associated protein 3